MKESPAFVDSVILISAFHRRDQHHEHALPIVMAADEGTIPPLWSTDFILAETINFLTRKGGSAVGRDALDRLEQSQGFRFQRISDNMYHNGKNSVFPKIDGLSFTDALTVAFMEEQGIRWIYSFDQGFDRVKGIQRIAAVPR